MIQEMIEELAVALAVEVVDGRKLCSSCVADACEMPTPVSEEGQSLTRNVCVHVRVRDSLCAH